jgi:integrase
MVQEYHIHLICAILFYGTLERLRSDCSPEGRETLSIFTFLFTSGLRAARSASVLSRDLAIRPHAMWRTLATLLVRGGMDLKSVQVLTHHASIKTLCKHYVDTNARSSPTFDGNLQEASRIGLY